MNVAVLQLRADLDSDANLEQAGFWLDRAAEAGARLAVLPENFAYFGRRDFREIARLESFGQAPARRLLAARAKQHGIWIVGGTLPLYAANASPTIDERPFACSLVFDGEGRECARYDKLHLFDVTVAASNRSYRESEDYRHGGDVVSVQTPVGVIGLSVCYDLRFPELYRALVALGSEILVVPSAFTATTGAAHWRLLLQARAVENQCYVMGADLAGRDQPVNPTWGGSAIIDPWGTVLGELADEPGFLIADLDLQQLAEVRRNMPVLEHRRFTVVKER